MTLFCSTCGAENGTRTRDPNLGKVVLYQLSYFRLFSSENNQYSQQRFSMKTYCSALGLRENSALSKRHFSKCECKGKAFF